MFGLRIFNQKNFGWARVDRQSTEPTRVGPLPSDLYFVGQYDSAFYPKLSQVKFILKNAILKM